MTATADPNDPSTWPEIGRWPKEPADVPDDTELGDGEPSPRCENCGYTEEDARLHLDHYLCKNKDNPPWKSKSGESGAAQEVSPPSPEPGFDEATEARWQKAIYEACKKVLDHSLWHLIDGAGCDSGDALDFTLSEIRQTFNILQNPEAEEDTRELKAALLKLKDVGLRLSIADASHRGCAHCSNHPIPREWAEMNEALKVAEKLLG